MEDTEEIVTAIIGYIAAIVANLIKIVPQSAQPAVMKDICAALNDAIDKAKSEKVN